MELARLFDSCDDSKTGLVSVSRLLSAVKEDFHKSGNKLEVKDKEYILQIVESVSSLIDPLAEDKNIDKATWLAAWQGQEGSKMGGGDDCNVIDSVSVDEGGPLDQSRHSYCFSPSSQCSSLVSEPEETALLQQENLQLRHTVSKLKEQLQSLEENTAQEQIDNQELEKTLHGLEKQIKKLDENLKNENSNLLTCEREKLELGKTLSQEIVKLKTHIADQDDKITTLSADIEELTKTVNEYEFENKNLRAKLEQSASDKDRCELAHHTVITMKEDCNHSLPVKKDLSSCSGESQALNLHAEFESLGEKSHQDLLLTNGGFYQQNLALSAGHRFQASTHADIGSDMDVEGSLFEEMEAAVSGCPQSMSLSQKYYIANTIVDWDCSFDDVEVSTSQHVNEVLSGDKSPDNECTRLCDDVSTHSSPNSVSDCNNESSGMALGESGNKGSASNICQENPEEFPVESTNAVILSSLPPITYANASSSYGCRNILAQTSDEASCEKSQVEVGVLAKSKESPMTIHSATCSERSSPLTSCDWKIEEKKSLLSGGNCMDGMQELTKKNDQSIQSWTQTSGVESQMEELNQSGSLSYKVILKEVLDQCSQTEVPVHMDLVDSNKPLKEDVKAVNKLKNVAKRCCFIVVLAISFFALAVMLSIFIAVICLEEAVLSGHLKPPYHGYAPVWLKQIMRPFIQITPRRLHPI